MSSGKSAFNYNALDSAKREIRLLAIQPGSWLEEIRCNLNVVSLDDNPKYEALSYVWGDASVLKPIDLDGFRFDVTQNLFLALRRLRSPEVSRVMWIDAVCINQKDDDEKSAQVSMMGSIYSTCIRGILWLGEDPELVNSVSQPESATAQKAFELLRLLGAGLHLNELACFSATKTDKIVSRRSFASHFEALRVMTYIPWWTRIWIVQEAVLPKEVVFAFASETCPYETIYNVQDKFGTHANTCCLELWHSLYEDLEIQNLLIDMNAYHGTLVSARRQWTSGAVMTLAGLRSRFWSFEATNRRDLFYGLLGIVNRFEGEPPIFPDYRLSDADAIARVLYQSIKQSRNLEILQGNRWMPPLPETPSWFPDMHISLVDRATATRDRRYKSHLQALFSASPDPYADVKLVGDTCAILKVHSSKIDTIKVVGEKPEWTEYETWLDRSKTIRQWMVMVGITDWPSEAREGSVYDSFWRTIINDCIQLQRTEPPFFRRAEQADYYNMRDYLSAIWNEEALRDPPEKDGIKYPHYLALMESRMFVTNRGLIGMAPSKCLVGDEIHILHGSKVPYVLRRISGSEVSVDHAAILAYTVIGDCYLHGSMDHGGAVEDRTCRIDLY